MGASITPVCPQLLQRAVATPPQVRTANSTGSQAARKRRGWLESRPDLVASPGGAALSARQTDLRHVAQEHVGRVSRRRHISHRRAEQASEGLARGSVLGTDPGDAAGGYRL